MIWIRALKPALAGQGAQITMNTTTLAAGMALLVAMTPTLLAQKLSIGNDVLTQGATVSVSFEDPSQAGKTIVVVASDGGVFPSTHNIFITLDASGKGAATWEVPTWSEVSFNPPKGKDVTLPCVPASSDGTAWRGDLAGMRSE